jgi:formate dehydrogenase maturation protein FdhE
MGLPNTSRTKCVKCDSSDFELVEDFPSKSAFIMHYIRCYSCKTFLQAIPYFDTNHKIEILQEDIDKIKAKLLIY